MPVLIRVRQSQAAVPAPTCSISPLGNDILHFHDSNTHPGHIAIYLMLLMTAATSHEFVTVPALVQT